jgi:hypothetical protein
MNRTPVRRRRILAASLLVGAVVVGSRAAGAAGDGQSVPAARRHVVRPGETLWSIALGAAPGRDPRHLIDAIERLNGLTGDDLVPGLELRIPSAA